MDDQSATVALLDGAGGVSAGPLLAAQTPASGVVFNDAVGYHGNVSTRGLPPGSYTLRVRFDSPSLVGDLLLGSTLSRRAFGVLALACLLLACTQRMPDAADPNMPFHLSVADLKAERAASAMPDGSVLIGEVGGERFMNITGPQASFFGHVYGVQLSNEEVYGFYQRELTMLGWQPDVKPIVSSGELRGWGWCRPQLYFRLAIFDPKRYDRVGVVGGEQYRTVFDARLQEVNVTCPFTLPPRPSPSP